MDFILNNATKEPQKCYISTLELYNILQDAARSKLVVDVRPNSSFYKAHAIRTSVHLAFHNFEPPSNWNVSMLNKDFECIKYYWNDQECTTKSCRDWVLRGIMYKELILVDEDGEGVFVHRLRELLLEEGKVENNGIYILKGGFSQFSKDYPYLCSSSIANTKAMEGALPSEIVEGSVYLGSYENASNLQQLQSLGITHILNMADELENKYPDDFKYMKCRLDDTAANNITQFIDRCLDFVDSAKSNGNNGKVLIHCAMGISRSSAIAIAYMMRSNRWTFEQGREYVRALRSSIKPNEGFVAQLKVWEESLLLIETITLNDKINAS